MTGIYSQPSSSPSSISFTHPFQSSETPASATSTPFPLFLIFWKIFGRVLMGSSRMAEMLLLLIGLAIAGPRLDVEALSMDYYAASCPFVEMIVRDAVNQALRRDPTLSGPLLRMHFHDCFVEVGSGSRLHHHHHHRLHPLPLLHGSSGFDWCRAAMAPFWSIARRVTRQRKTLLRI